MNKKNDSKLISDLPKESMVNEEEIDLREYIHVLMKRKWILVLTTVIAVLISAIVSYLFLPPLYQASSIFKLAQINGNPLFGFNEIENMIKSDDILQNVLDKLELELTLEQLSKKVNMKNIGDSGFLEVMVEYESPEMANAITFSIVNDFIAKSQEMYNEKLKLIQEEKKTIAEHIEVEEETIDGVKKLRYAILDSKELSISEKQIQENLLYNYYAQLRENYSMLINKYYSIERQLLDSSNFEITNYASIPEKPVKPNKKLNLAIAGILGLFMGIFFVFFLEFWQAGNE